ncbi:hypothetical protein I532_21725 [Brevibacillus borstelensis AK1]|jgi:hypothetical protein|uniref:Uncharacterized protein n=1 Tax=Brevibacillus borstelensis AK1 TaxID=1300222 RepID=M8DU77_9BACL|nr:hypothetical protein I532_21725 [Brevibacillus borstelensis AK1]
MITVSNYERQKREVRQVEKDLIEIPHIDIPDEIRQVDLPEIGETTPHPKPSSPSVQTGETERSVGFLAE